MKTFKKWLGIIIVFMVMINFTVGCNQENSKPNSQIPKPNAQKPKKEKKIAIWLDNSNEYINLLYLDVVRSKEHHYIQGKAVNLTDKSIDFLKIRFAFLNKDGETIQEDFIEEKNGMGPLSNMKFIKPLTKELKNKLEKIQVSVVEVNLKSEDIAKEQSAYQKPAVSLIAQKKPQPLPKPITIEPKPQKPVAQVKPVAPVVPKKEIPQTNYIDSEQREVAERYNRKAQSLIYSNDLKSAAEYINKAIDIDPNNGVYYETKGRIYYILSSSTYSAEAMDSYNKAISINPYKSMNYYIVGNMHRYNKNFKTAIDFYNKAISLEEDKLYRANYYSSKAKAMEEIGDFRGAYKSYKKAMELDPDNSTYELLIKDNPNFRGFR